MRSPQRACKPARLRARRPPFPHSFQGPLTLPSPQVWVPLLRARPSRSAAGGSPPGLFLPPRSLRQRPGLGAGSGSVQPLLVALFPAWRPLCGLLPVCFVSLLAAPLACPSSFPAPQLEMKAREPRALSMRNQGLVGISVQLPAYILGFFLLGPGSASEKHHPPPPFHKHSSTQWHAQP